MREKILKKYTTIPPSLYVSRSADQQLRDIIEEMQRPGYVLVARQMGKTNLLFNAKRELESDDRKFVYIDLSNNFETERECYNFIIDSILDVYCEELDSIYDVIKSLRDNTKTDHLSYTKSLRTILNTLGTDLVIILDEIDALRTSEYSDNIFAVIRSNYFTRSNFPEFERLTYILSGVIEPKDLIKDRNKSPFNIGEKIYLDDFTKLEFKEFIENSQLKICSDLIDHIYEWTSGNPRLSFDICSEVESILMSQDSITCLDIDTLIIDKYLTSFDIAPVDHIRELVSEDKDIQKSIHSIISGNQDEYYISDNIKNKLYLYGIIDSRNSNDKLSIKNRIIEKTLNLSWLKSLSENIDEVIEKGIKLIVESHNYHDAIILLTDIVNSDNEKVSKSPNYSLALFYLGLALHYVGRHKESNEYMKRAPYKKNNSPIIHYRQRLFIGLNHLQLSEVEDGNKELMYVIDNYPNTLTWANAVLAIYDKYSVESIQLLKKFVATPDENIDDEDEADKVHIISQLRSYAYYYLSALEADDDKPKAIDYINLALSVDVYEHKPSLIAFKATLTDKETIDAVKESISFIIDNQLTLDEAQSNFTDLKYGKHLNCTLLGICFSDSKEYFNKLKSYSINTLKLSEESIYLDINSITNDHNLKYNLLNEYFEKSKDHLSVNFIRRYIIDSINVRALEEITINMYFGMLLDDYTLVDFDIVTIALIIKNDLDRNNPTQGIRHFEKIHGLLVNLSESLRYDSSTIYFWTTECYADLDDRKNIQRLGREVLERLNHTTSEKTLIDVEGEKSIRSRVTDLFQNPANKVTYYKPFRNTKKYGRNTIITVRYKNGKESTNKYKKLESDIAMNLCEII